MVLCVREVVGKTLLLLIFFDRLFFSIFQFWHFSIGRLNLTFLKPELRVADLSSGLKIKVDFLIFFSSKRLSADLREVLLTALHFKLLDTHLLIN